MQEGGSPSCGEAERDRTGDGEQHVGSKAEPRRVKSAYTHRDEFCGSDVDAQVCHQTYNEIRSSRSDG